MHRLSIPSVRRIALANPGPGRGKLQVPRLKPNAKRAALPESEDCIVEDCIAEDDKRKLEEMIGRFKKADLDGNGQLCRDELNRMLISSEPGDELLTQHWLPGMDLDRVMEVYDKDRNGVIDFEEFKELVYDGLMLDGKLSEYYKAFQAVDTGGNGSIGAAELAQMLTATGKSISYEKLVAIMQKFDKDESGQIEFPEFLMMFREEDFLDLKEVMSYVSLLPKDDGNIASGVFEPLSGELTPIFSERELDEAILMSGDKVVVVFCALTWCRSCKSLQRPMQKIAAHYKDKALFIKLFGNSNSQTKRIFKDRLAVRSTPSFIFYKDSKVVVNKAGGTSEKLESILREVLGPDALPEVLYKPEPEKA